MKKIAVAVIISVITLADLCGQEKSVEYEGQVSAYISYPSPGFGDWLNPGCGLMTVHGVRFNRADLFLGASVGLDLQFPWFPVPAFTVGLQPKYYFVDRLHHKRIRLGRGLCPAGHRRGIQAAEQPPRGPLGRRAHCPGGHRVCRKPRLRLSPSGPGLPLLTAEECLDL